MEMWAFDWTGPEGRGAYVLRLAPSADYMADRPYGHPVEAALVRAAHNGGVKAPEVVGVLADGDRMGKGYVMRRVVAEGSPATRLAAPPPSDPKRVGLGTSVPVRGCLGCGRIITKKQYNDYHSMIQHRIQIL